MSYSYHWVENDMLREAVAMIVAKKGKTLRELALLTDNRNNASKKGYRDGRSQLRMNPAMRARTFTDGIADITTNLDKLGLLAPRKDVPVSAMNETAQYAKMAELWVCRCTEQSRCVADHTVYKIHKRGVMDKCFGCGELEGNSSAPNLEEGVAYLKEMERKERAIKEGGSW